MITQAEATQTYTPAEYLELEINSDLRHEYRNGEIISMTGGTPNHNEIAGNLYILLKSNLKGQPYRTFYADQRLWIPIANLYTYPDVMVLPKPIQLQPDRKDTVINPCCIAEVLSKSTQNYDRSEKFIAYRTIPTLQEYLLIDQYRIHVEQYVRTSPYQWLLLEHTDPTITLTLQTLNLQIPIAELYEDIDLSNP